MSDAALMQLALDARLGSSAVTPGNVVDLLYFNLFNSLPSASDRQFYVDLVNDGSFSMVSLALVASEVEANLVNIEFAGIQSAGLAYSI